MSRLILTGIVAMSIVGHTVSAQTPRSVEAYERESRKLLDDIVKTKWWSFADADNLEGKLDELIEFSDTQDTLHMRMGIDVFADISFSYADHCLKIGQLDRAESAYRKVIKTLVGQAQAGYRDRAKIGLDDVKAARMSTRPPTSPRVEFKGVAVGTPMDVAIAKIKSSLAAKAVFIGPRKLGALWMVSCESTIANQPGRATLMFVAHKGEMLLSTISVTFATSDFPIVASAMAEKYGPPSEKVSSFATVGGVNTTSITRSWTLPSGTIEVVQRNSKLTEAAAFFRSRELAPIQSEAIGSKSKAASVDL